MQHLISKKICNYFLEDLDTVDRAGAISREKKIMKVELETLKQLTEEQKTELVVLQRASFFYFCNSPASPSPARLGSSPYFNYFHNLKLAVRISLSAEKLHLEIVTVQQTAAWAINRCKLINAH